MSLIHQNLVCSGNGKMIIKKVTVKKQVWGFSACLRMHYLSLEMSVICGMYRICYYRKYRLMNLQLPQS